MKLISEIADFNPFEIRPLVISYLQILLELRSFSNIAKDSAKYSSFLSTITKNCHECTRLCSSSIISVT